MKPMTLVLVLILAVGSAQVYAQPEKSVTDVKYLAGTWQGYPYDRVTGKRGRKLVTIAVKEDGSYEASGAIIVQGSLRVDGGKVLFQSSRASGTVILSEDKGQETMKFSFENGNPAGEYDRVK